MADTLDLPVVDLGPYLAAVEAAKGGVPTLDSAVLEQAKAAADALHRFGVLVVRDPRASEAENSAFLDMLEQYFEQPEEVVLADVRKELYYQVGTTPALVELPRHHCARMLQYKEGDRPLSLCPPEKDKKGRFFWRIGAQPPATKFPQLNAAPVVPAAFPEWAARMDSWGAKLLGAAEAVAQLAAVGFGLPWDSFSGRMQYGPHLLAPTSSDFKRFGTLGEVLAGYHYDLNFITAHGKSRYPGLFIWTREGQKKTVKIPDGCLLVQAGKQFEHITGGHVLAGFHEVVVTPGTVDAIAAAKAAGRSLWRISSTLFSHIASDVLLAPLERFATPEALAAYPPMLTGEHVAAELAAINLGEGSDGTAGTHEGGAAPAR